MSDIPKNEGEINIEELLKMIDGDSFQIEKIPQSRKGKKNYHMRSVKQLINEKINQRVHLILHTGV